MADSEISQTIVLDKADARDLARHLHDSIALAISAPESWSRVRRLAQALADVAGEMERADA